MKKTLITFLLAVSVISAVYAGFTFSPSVQGNLGASFCHPTEDYLKYSQGRKLPFLRTSFAAEFDAMLADITFNEHWEAGAGFAIQGTSESLAAGIHTLRPYSGMGVALAVNRNFDRGFALGIKARYLFCKYKPFNYKFNTVDICAVPAYKIYDKSGFDVLMTCPLTVSIKSDALTIRAGVGLNLKYNIRLKAGEI